MDVASATLSGGVAVGAVADMMIGPAVAFASGTAVGVVSTLGFRKIQSAIHSKIGWVRVGSFLAFQLWSPGATSY